MTDDWPELDAHIQAMMDQYRTPGLALALAHDGALVLGKGYGYRDIEAKLPATVKTVFPAASVTKSFTALAVMQLQDSGQLSVSDPVVKYLPEFQTPDPAATSRITIHHFLTHTAGLPLLPSRWFAFARDAARDWEPDQIPVRLSSRPPIDTHEQLMEFIAETRWTPLGPPGKFMSYSNEGYALLGAIVARVSGLPYPEYVNRHILTPLNLHCTRFDAEMPGEGLEATALYDSKSARGTETIVRAPRWWSSNVWQAAGGLCSSVGDLIRYLEVYRPGAQEDRIVSRAAVEAMTRPHVPTSPRRAYGYGFEILPDYHGETVVAHSGGRLGGSSHILFVPGRGISAAALANHEGTPTWLPAHAAAHRLLDLPVDWRPTPYPRYALSKARLKAYLGEYGGSGTSTITVTANAHGLVLEIAGRRYAARPIGDDAFTIIESESEVYVRFLVDERRRPWAVAHGITIRPLTRKPALSGVRLAKSIARQIRSRLSLRR